MMWVSGRGCSCDFEYHCNLMEQMMLGLVAYRASEVLDYDSEAGVGTNHPAANSLLARNYRDGWTLEG